MKTYNLSVAVWVGFIALFGIATDDGVVVATYLKQSFEKRKPENVKEVRKAVLEAGEKRVLPAMMTTATTSAGTFTGAYFIRQGFRYYDPDGHTLLRRHDHCSDYITVLMVPVLYSWWAERKLKEEP
jgi:copper/silver efflux system protein